MQIITISGNLTADASALVDQSGKEYISFKVAVNEVRKGEKSATFYDVTAPKTGVFDYLKKGQGVIVCGSLSISVVEKDDKTFTNIRVFAREVELVGQGKAAQ